LDGCENFEISRSEFFAIPVLGVHCVYEDIEQEEGTGRRKRISRIIRGKRGEIMTKKLLLRRRDYSGLHTNGHSFLAPPFADHVTNLMI
jgi:hypothetical protein